MCAVSLARTHSTTLDTALTLSGALRSPFRLPDPGPSSHFLLVPAASPVHVAVSTSKVLSAMHWQKMYSNSPESAVWVSFHNFSATNFG